ncbi:MAG: 50S ribosomal protein L32 [Candidatus Margulisbacteria bacterium]|nr:50S ribosomal protein L32 [Candidatus Margulisiibacteriota bacterium]
MPVPKRRRSKSKKRSHHANWKIETPNLVPCAACRALIVQHRVCPDCGVYNGKQVLVIKEKTKKAD